MRVKKKLKEGGEEKEVLVNPPTMWEVRIAVVPSGQDLAVRLLMLGQVVRSMRDDNKIPVVKYRWNGLEAEHIVATSVNEILQDKTLLFASVGELAGLATYYVVTIGLDSNVSRDFTRISERDMRTKKIQENS